MRHEALLPQVGDAEVLPAGQAVAGRRHEHHAVPVDDLAHQLRMEGVVGDEPHVQAALQHLGRDALGGLAVGLELDGGPGLLVGQQDPGQQELGHALVGADVQAALLEALEGAEGVEDLLPQVEHALGKREQGGAGVREGAALGGAVHQGLAQLLLEALQGEAHGGLGAEETLRRAGEALLARDHQERFQLSEVHGPSVGKCRVLSITYVIIKKIKCIYGLDRRIFG